MGIIERMRQVAAEKKVLADKAHEECAKWVEGFRSGRPEDTEMYVTAYRRVMDLSAEYMVTAMSVLELEMMAQDMEMNSLLN